MGYYMEQIDSQFIIKKENKVKALETLQKMVKENTTLPWVSTTDVLASSSLEEAMCECRWELYKDEEDNVIDIYFNGEKSGSDTAVFNAIAPYVENNSFIEMQGEDGELW